MMNYFGENNGLSKDLRACEGLRVIQVVNTNHPGLRQRVKKLDTSTCK